MGRLDLPDKRVDWVQVTREYLHELYSTIERLKSELQEAKNAHSN